MLLKLKCRRFKKIIIGKNILLILNSNPNLDIQTVEFKNQWISNQGF